MKIIFAVFFLKLLTVSASDTGSEHILNDVSNPDPHDVVGALKSHDDLGSAVQKMLRSGLPQAAISDGISSTEEDLECRLICEDDVIGDACIGTATNPVPNGDVWMFNRDVRSFGCCAFGSGACKECCPPSPEIRSAFLNANPDTLVLQLYNEMEEDIENFDSEDSDDDPWEVFSGVCMTLNEFTIDDRSPINTLMSGIVAAGAAAIDNGRLRNRVSFTDAGVYHEISQLSFLGGGAITYKILGYDYSGQSPGSRLGTNRVVELPFELAPHGRAMFTPLETNPEEYGPGVKIAYRLISPYIGDVLVKFECCTEEEILEFEEVSEPSTDLLPSPVPPVRFTSTSEECQQIAPVYQRFVPP